MNLWQVSRAAQFALQACWEPQEHSCIPAKFALVAPLLEYKILNSCKGFAWRCGAIANQSPRWHWRQAISAETAHITMCWNAGTMTVLKKDLARVSHSCGLHSEPQFYVMYIYCMCVCARWERENSLRVYRGFLFRATSISNAKMWKIRKYSATALAQVAWNFSTINFSDEGTCVFTS